MNILICKAGTLFFHGSDESQNGRTENPPTTHLTACADLTESLQSRLECCGLWGRGPAWPSTVHRKMYTPTVVQQPHHLQIFLCCYLHFWGTFLHSLPTLHWHFQCHCHHLCIISLLPSVQYSLSSWDKHITFPFSIKTPNPGLDSGRVGVLVFSWTVPLRHTSSSTPQKEKKKILSGLLR